MNNDKAAKSHSHAWSEITSKPSTFTPSTHSHSTITVSMVSDCLTQTCPSDGLHAYAFATSATNKPENAAGTIISIPNGEYVTRLALVFYSGGGGHLYISFYSPGVSYGSWTKVI